MCQSGETGYIIIKNKRVRVDKCLVPILTELNKLGIKTIASCCGHGNQHNFYIVITKNSYTTIDKPFCKPLDSIRLRNRNATLIPNRMKSIDGLFLVNNNAKVNKRKVE